MDVVMHLYICLFVRAWKESCTFMKLQCILVILYIFHVLCYIMLFGINQLWSFNFDKNILTTYQNSPKSVFISLHGFKHLV